ncbi:MAG: lactate utilization protein [Clostridiales bacterium]|nr:lactate utilization protein [Clostridiales bacterium]
MTPRKQYYETIANTLIDKMKPRGIDAYYVSDSKEALDFIKNMLTPGASVSFGGSATLKEIGFHDFITHSADYQVFDRTTATTPEEKRKMYQEIVGCDYFFMSSNAITLDGELVNIDGYGNRVACLIAGPQQVVIVAGMNKIVPDVDSAIARVRNIAAPPNTIRLNKNTPCASTGRCGNCLSDDCICCQTVITRKSSIPNRIQVILVGETLGF